MHLYTICGRLTVRFVIYYIWCKSVITFKVDIPFSVNILSYLRLILHLMEFVYLWLSLLLVASNTFSVVTNVRL